MTRYRSLMTCMLLALIAMAGTTHAALPPTPSTWVNGNRMDLNALKGKIVVLQFYEET